MAISREINSIDHFKSNKRRINTTLWRWENIRDWLYVEDHIDAILTCLSQGEIGESYCIGNEERNNKEVMEIICKHLDQLIPEKRPHSDLIKFVQDRPGHDRRYAINSTRIKNELNWEPHHSFEEE